MRISDWSSDVCSSDLRRRDLLACRRISDPTQNIIAPCVRAQMPPWLYARPQGLEYHSIKIEGASPQDAAIITVSLSVRQGLMSHRLFECTTPLPIPADISDSTAAPAPPTLPNRKADREG